MKQQRRPWWRILAVLAAIGLLAAACGDDDDSDAKPTGTSIQTGQVGADKGDDVDDAPEYGGKIIVGLETETDEWNPSSGQFAVPGMTVALSFYDPLIVLDGNGEFSPYLAESLEPNDELTEWTLKLRNGVEFHDGTKLNAEVLKWNFDTLHFADGVRNRGSLDNGSVSGMEIVDDMTVKYILDEPNAAFPDLLRSYIGFPVSQAAYEADPEGFGSNPVGTGPFEFVSWTRDDRLVVKKNENYWFTTEAGDQLPYLDEIEFRVIPDDQSRTASLESDDIQVLQSLRGPSIKKVLSLTDTGNFDASLFVGNESSITVVNTLVAPLDDVRVRRALAYANNQEAMAQVRDDDGLVPPSTGFFSQDSPWYSAEAVKDYPGASGRDSEAAKELIDEYKADPDRSDGLSPGDPVTIDYICQPDPSLLQGAQMLQDVWKEIGIDLHLTQLDQSAMISRVVGTQDTNPPYLGDFQLTCFRAGGGEGDPLSNLQGYFGPVATTAGNFSNFSDPKIDEALDTLQSSADFATRYAAVEEISRITSEEVPFIWNVGTPTLVGYRGDVRGIPTWTLPDGTPGSGTPGAITRFHQTYLKK